MNGKLWLMAVLMCATQALGGAASHSEWLTGAQKGGAGQATRRISFVRAVVIDARFSALRREPSLQSEVIHRLRLGRPVFIIRDRYNVGAHTGFVRIAASRRTRGWVHQLALAVPGRPGEDQRIMKLIETTSDGFDRITLCRVLIDRFSGSRLVPRSLLLIGEEGERSAETLTRHARRQLAESSSQTLNAGEREFFLNDPALDRYSRLRIVFDFNEQTHSYVYDGRAYRDLLARFPNSEEASLARRRLDQAKGKIAEH